jgi:hypothetical protein
LIAFSALVAAPFAGCGGAGLKASIAKPAAGYYRILEPVPIDFDKKIDAKSIRMSVTPQAGYSTQVKGNRLLLTPMTNWKAATTYTITLKQLASADHSTSVSNWKGRFTTQPHTGIAGFLVDGQAVTGQPTVRPISHLGLAFTEPMNTSSVKVTLDDHPVDASKLQWSQDAKTVMLNAALAPYKTVRLSVADGAKTHKGDPITDLTTMTATTLGIEPSNPSSGIDGGFKTKPPVLVVIDNAGLARPQYGLQDADMVYEYISEYNISRFTLVYFNNSPGAIGPVRSCRMINAYLVNDFDAIQMCSGASIGTLHYLFGDKSVNMPLLRVVINDFDNGNHFFRVGFKPGPHNLFTANDRVSRAQGEWGDTSPTFAIDPPHSDIDYGSPADAPSIPLHHVSYSYDAGSQSYLPFDQGAPRVDANHGGGQLHVKNVAIMHVNFHDAGWVEDDNGGAHSIWYDMNGSGPAEIWSNGKVIQAIWHQGNPDDAYYANNKPVYFTDQDGNLIRLNSGLTWIHVVGNGQTS